MLVSAVEVQKSAAGRLFQLHFPRAFQFLSTFEDAPEAPIVLCSLQFHCSQRNFPVTTSWKYP